MTIKITEAYTIYFDWLLQLENSPREKKKKNPKNIFMIYR